MSRIHLGVCLAPAVYSQLPRSLLTYPIHSLSYLKSLQGALPTLSVLPVTVPPARPSCSCVPPQPQYLLCPLFLRALLVHPFFLSSFYNSCLSLHFTVLLETGSHSIIPELTMQLRSSGWLQTHSSPLPQSLQCWSYRCKLPCPDSFHSILGCWLTCCESWLGPGHPSSALETLNTQSGAK